MAAVVYGEAGQNVLPAGSESDNDLLETNAPATGESGSAGLLLTDSYEDISYEDCLLGDKTCPRQGSITTISCDTSELKSVVNHSTAIETKNDSSSGSANELSNDESSEAEKLLTPTKLSNALEQLFTHERTLSRSHGSVTDADQVDRVPELPGEADDVHSPAWRHQRKHVFILSEAGKPIYSRHGNEDKLVTIMGVMQALVSFVQDSKDSIRSIISGDHKIVFLTREHLLLVAVSRGADSTQQLLLQLNYVYNQVISVLTFTQLSKIYKQRRNYDLRRLLTGAEKFLDSLLDMLDSEPGLLLGAVRCLPLELSVRDTVTQTILQYVKVKDLVFAIVLCGNQLVSLVRMKKYFLHPMDLHLIMNLVSASESFKAAESWTPICLPKFDPSGYLHAHISYLDETCRTCLLLLTVDRDSFFTLSDCKRKICDRLNRYHCLEAINHSITRTSYSIQQCGISDLRHFLYKSWTTAQYTSPEIEAPYLSAGEQERLFGLYQYLHNKIHMSSRPLKILYHVGRYETLLGWVTSGFELYAVFGPLVTKHIAIHAINKLLRWIKREEDKLFILNSVTF